jgi:hypothetical protein
MRILQNWMHWTGPAARFSRSGAKSSKNMSPKIHPVKTFSGKDARQPGFKTGFRGQESGVRKVKKNPVIPNQFDLPAIQPILRWKNYTNYSFTGFRFFFTVC